MIPDVSLRLLPELIDQHQCAGSEDAVQERINKLVEEWEYLTSKSSEKSEKLKEANRQRMYTAAVKDLEFWLGEVIIILIILIFGTIFQIFFSEWDADFSFLCKTPNTQGPSVLAGRGTSTAKITSCSKFEGSVPDAAGSDLRCSMALHFFRGSTFSTQFSATTVFSQMFLGVPYMGIDLVRT